jgi:hypothetical protein
MDEDQSETNAGAANDDTEVVADDFTRLRKAAGGKTERRAWSDADEDDDDDEQPERHPWSVVTGQAAALISAGAAVATVTAVLGWIMLHKDRPAPSPSPPSATAENTTTPAAAPPPTPPATVTITAAPPTNMPSPGPAPPALPTTSTTPGRSVYERGSVYDKAFLDLMAQEGWTCTDTQDHEQCGKEMLSFAHQACSYSGQSYSFLYQTFGLPSMFGPREMRRALANASQAYPNCTFTGSP